MSKPISHVRSSSDVAAAFTTHANYLRAFATLASSDRLSASAHDIYTSCAERLSASGCLAVRRSRHSDDQTRRCLEHAWGTELIMALTARVSDEEELVRLSNNWLAVQTYYCLYHGTQAAWTATGAPRPETHPKTQQIFAGEWSAPGRNLVPWSLAVDAAGPRNTGIGVIVDTTVKPLRAFAPQMSLSLACKALTTTHSEYATAALQRARAEKQKQARRSWDADERHRLGEGKRARTRPTRFSLPTLSVDERKDCLARVRPASIMDYLWRLRVRTNYVDSAMFTDGPTESSDSKDVRSCLRLPAGTTLFMSEGLVMSRVGKPTLLKWASDWIAANVPSTLLAGVASRLPILRDLRLPP